MVTDTINQNQGSGRRQASIAIVFVFVFLACVGCKKQAPVKGDFRANDTAGKVPAIVDASKSDDRNSLEELVYALGDEDPAVRLFAIQSLKDRTGQDFGYRYYAPAEQRDQAQQRWRAWLSESAEYPAHEK